MAKTKVLVVDDSALIRQVLSSILTADEELEVVGVASDPYIAWEKINKLSPDVLTLDVEMPRMDGLTFLDKLMKARPLPVVMVSSLTEKGCETTLRALELGAIDFVTKPKVDIRQGTVELAGEIVAKVKAAARAKVRHRHVAAAPVQPRPPKVVRGPAAGGTLIAIGSSTGGTQALRDVLTQMPADSPPIVIVQHMPEKFTSSFAARLDSLCEISVAEARDGDRVLQGQALIAPGNYHMELVRAGTEHRVRIFTGDAVNFSRPSVDVLFHSCARTAGSKAVGAILTGMGSDGARGLLAMRQAGARTLAQDEASCVVFGMPKEALAIGAAEEAVSLHKIPAELLRLSGRPSA